ncbi:MAG: 50S ribosomal protein L6 [Deltaproteobacteria bacterium]|nr:50S ribosomal protein L6 [Deltaproteobacteria bacterium]MBI3293537.1 50S ribosomal protein L6 [Deltaproteobacteria bacterium]
MSRVGKKTIKVPAGVKVSFKAPLVEVSGKAGSIKKIVPSSIAIEIKGDEITVRNLSDDPGKHNLHGLWRTLVANMVHGALNGYSRDLELQGVGYRATVQGSKLSLTLGFSHPVEFPLPQGISAAVEANTKISLKGADKELVGLVASNLRKIKPPEPYKGKGIRYQGEIIQLKQGKTAGAGGAGGGK